MLSDLEISRQSPRLYIDELRLCDGAGFVYALAGPTMTMPGLGSLPAYRHIDIDDEGEIVGLS